MTHALSRQPVPAQWSQHLINPSFQIGRLLQYGRPVAQHPGPIDAPIVTSRHLFPNTRMQPKSEIINGQRTAAWVIVDQQTGRSP